MPPITNTVPVATDLGDLAELIKIKMRPLATQLSTGSSNSAVVVASEATALIPETIKVQNNHSAWIASLIVVAVSVSIFLVTGLICCGMSFKESEMLETLYNTPSHLLHKKVSEDYADNRVLRGGDLRKVQRRYKSVQYRTEIETMERTVIFKEHFMLLPRWQSSQLNSELEKNARFVEKG